MLLCQGALAGQFSLVFGSLLLFFGLTFGEMVGNGIAAAAPARGEGQHRGICGGCERGQIRGFPDVSTPGNMASFKSFND